MYISGQSAFALVTFALALKRLMDEFIIHHCQKNNNNAASVYLLLIRQIQRLQLGVLMSSVDFQQVVKVGGEDQRAALHQLQHRAQQMLPCMLHLTLQVVKHLVEAVLEKRRTHIAGALKERKTGEKN